MLQSATKHKSFVQPKSASASLSWSNGIKMSQLKSENIFSPSIWMNPTMNYGIVLCSSQFGCEAYTFSERQSICALYNVQVHWPFQSMTNSHRFEYFYLERRIEATYRSNAHYYTENRIDMTSNRSNRSTL